MRKFIATICTVTLLFASASLAVAQDAATIRGDFRVGAERSHHRWCRQHFCRSTEGL